ncbi:DUF397 domain-containing protein [Kitasatospora mediocidica]|uniref:DUF397 domain-containing protein n=1 Tax=Kitasatospora mediocidica TaxID=58352 RepID=UPI00056AFB7F|nr:DUF397 domain-containing protein [Kitasatospora mediocidica]
MSTGLVWFKSSHSGTDSGDCIEVASCPRPSPTIHVRDSKDPSGPQLAFAPASWAAFVAFAAAQAPA